VHACSRKHKKEDHGPGQPKYKGELMLKITQTKWDGGIAQAVEGLPNKCKSLNSNLSSNSTKVPTLSQE
jgi:hypothetical protein